MTLTGMVRTGLRQLFSCLAPPRCRLCRAPLLDHDNAFLCPDCATKCEWIGEGACRGCGYPAGPHASHGDECRRCRGNKLRLTAAAAVARYHSGAKELVLGLKFRGETELARPMAGLMAARLRAVAFPGVDIILPVALHSARRRGRGFDQAEMLAHFLALHTHIPTASRLLWRVRHTSPQTTLRREARLHNMSGAFRASPQLIGLNILLVDDVMTTGATMASCAEVCREAGARRVYGLVFAR